MRACVCVCLGACFVHLYVLQMRVHALMMRSSLRFHAQPRITRCKLQNVRRGNLIKRFHLKIQILRRRFVISNPLIRNSVVTICQRKKQIRKCVNFYRLRELQVGIRFIECVLECNAAALFGFFVPFQTFLRRPT